MCALEISISRAKLRAARRFAVAAGTVVGAIAIALVFCELLARMVLSPPRTEPIRLDDERGELGAFCYPRMSGASLPVDLDTPAGRASFTATLGRVRAHLPESVVGKGALSALLGFVPAGEIVGALAQEVPLCWVYDLRRPEALPRALSTPTGFISSVALLGDSFVFGQGLAEHDTFTPRLASKLRARVRSYADAGAGLAEILGQFRHALDDAARFKFSTIVYVYVLNDPFTTDELAARLSYVNDLTNLRLQGTWQTPRTLAWLIGWVEERSVLARALAFQISSRLIAGETIAWYRDLNNPSTNPMLLRSFEEVAGLSRAARAREIDFVVLLYPLMLDMAHYPLAETHVALQGLAKSWGVELHDLLPAFQRAPAGAPLFVHPLDLHPSARAQEIAATEAAEYLSRRRSSR